MRTTKRTEIMLEAKQVIVIRSPHRRARLWCSGCAEATEMITPELASVLSNAPTRLIYRWIEDGKLHFTEKEDGRLLVCRNSLDLTVAAAAANPSFVASANLTTRPSGMPYYYDADMVVKTTGGDTVNGVRKPDSVMPWASFRNMTDEDLESIFAFLRRLKPVIHCADNNEASTYCRLCGQRQGAEKI